MGVKEPSKKAPTKEEVKGTNTLLGLTETLNKKIQKMDDQYKDIPTPIDFAKLQNDVSHHNKFIYGMLIAVIAIVITVFIALLGGYFHFDNKIGTVGDRINTEFKELNNTHRQLEEKINNEVKGVNTRIDSIIIPQNHLSNNE
jgi:cell division protein FtsL